MSALALVSAVTARGQSPLIWFCPLDPLVRPEVGYGGSPQYMELFSTEAAWTQAAARVSVYKIYPQWVTQATDEELKTQFADLKRRGIALALEWGMLTAPENCGRGVEGFGGQATLGALRRIQRLGGDLQYIAMDEPIYFGTLYKGNNACRWTLEQMAANAAANIKALHAEFPNVQVGDIEPFPVSETSPEWLAQYAKGIDALQAAIGGPLAFFHSDIAWFSGDWPAALAGMRREVEARGLPFGVIYNGDDSQRTDADWVGAGESRMTKYEAAAAPPGHVIFQSWNAYPRKLLPETDADSFTNLINRYFRTRTVLTAAVEGGVVSGTLAGDGPISGAPVEVAATLVSGDGVEGQYVFEGTTPANVEQLVFGIRVNLECGCSGASDFRVKEFRLESGDTVITRRFTDGLSGWGVSDRSAVAVEDGQLHVRAAAGQGVLVNSGPIPFPANQSPFRLTVTATVAPQSAGSGYFAGIFLGGKEVGRVRAPIAALEQKIGTVKTGDDGGYSIPVGDLPFGAWLVRVSYGGNASYWPGTVEVRTTLP